MQVMHFNQIHILFEVLCIFLVKTIAAISTVRHNLGIKPIDLCGPEQSESRVSKMSVSIRES
jgi:hypothetical protein